ncbi:uncharacterized protein LOC142354986, partial [Convolutriloba macropyga]|uniref:uncharacterized protein LOC142354986 n=1 Tax=Convolutriloba macropyga TaxID=536237 RepID=UPI003F51CCD0
MKIYLLSNNVSFVMVLISSICVNKCFGDRTWYFSDLRKVYEYRMVAEKNGVNQRELFDIRGSSGGHNGKICCLAVNYRFGRELFVSDTGENRIIRLTVNPDWSAVQPIREKITVLEDRVAYTMTFDDHTNFLFFSTIDYIWRVHRDGSMLRALTKLDDSSKVTSILSNSLKSELIWSTWRDSDQQGQLFISHLPLITCTNQLLNLNAKFEHLTLLNEDSLYAVDSLSSRVLKLNIALNSPARTMNLSPNHKFGKANVENVSSGTVAAAGLFVETGTKLIYLDSGLRHVIYCIQGECSAMPDVFTTQSTPTDLKLNLTRVIPSDVVRYEPKLMSRYQKYFFQNSVVFYFDTDESMRRNGPVKFTYIASLQLITSKGRNSSNSTSTEDGSKAMSSEVEAGKNNEFRHLLDGAKYRLNISFLETECQDSKPELLDSFVVCT